MLMFDITIIRPQCCLDPLSYGISCMTLLWLFCFTLYLSNVCVFRFSGQCISSLWKFFEILHVNFTANLTTNGGPEMVRAVGAGHGVQVCLVYTVYDAHPSTLN